MNLCNLITRVVCAAGLIFSATLFAADNPNDRNTHNGVREVEQPLKPNPETQSAPKGDEDPSNMSCNGTGSPVVLHTGEFVWATTDIVLAGRPAMRLTRSFRAFDSRDGLFGKGWSTHCEKALIPIIDYESGETPVRAYIYRLENGQRFKYLETSSGDYTTPEGLRGTSLILNANGTVSIGSIGGTKETYNKIGQLVSESDRNGNRINYTYDDGSLTTIADTNGRSLELVIDSTGHVISVTDHIGRQWTYDYNSDGSLAVVTDPLGGQLKYMYVQVNRFASSIDYPAISRVTDESGVVLVRVTYDEVGRVSTYTQGQNIYTYDYDELESGFVYKEDRLTDDRKAQWSYELDQFGRKTKIVHPRPIDSEESRNELFEYSENGNLTKYTDIDGTEFTSVYDQLGRMVSSTTPDGTTQYEYLNDTSWPASIQSPSGRVTKFTYDASGNPLTVTDPANFKTSFRWNSKGDLLSVTDALNGTVRQTYNSIGLVTSITDQLGRKTTFDHDALGNLTQVTDARGNSSQMSYDELDRMVGSTDALGNSTNYSVDASGRLLSLTDARGGVTAFEYDQYGRQTRETRADDSVIQYAYRGDNLLRSKTDPRGIVTSYLYNRAKELVSVKAGSEIATLSYDRMGRLINANYNGDLSYTYDTMSRVTNESQSNTGDVSYAYNSEGELVTVRALGEVWRYTYNNRGLMSRFSTPAGMHRYVYDKLGRQVSHTLPNGLVNTFAYDAASQLSTQDYSQTSGEVLGYTYDNIGQVTYISSVINTDWSYQYDEINRLVSATHDQQYNYQYDELGNRTENGGVYDRFNKLIENDDYNFKYDAAGNLISKVSILTGEQYRYSYNEFGRLSGVEIADSVIALPRYSATYTYDYTGRRIATVAGGEQEKFQWKGLNLIAHYTASNLNGIYRYSNGFTSTEYSQGSEVYQVQSDFLDIPISLGEGLSSSLILLSPYGSDLDSNLENIDFKQRRPGQYLDGDTGLLYNFHRFYDPQLGRYISSDPIGKRGGLNQYAYVENNPLKWIDVFALAKICYRPLNSWTTPVVIGRSGSQADRDNNIVGHEHILYDDGTDIGFGPDGLFSEPERRSDYIQCESGFDDDVLKEAVKKAPVGDYDFFRKNNNCQDWVERVRQQYWQLKNENISR